MSKQNPTILYIGTLEGAITLSQTVPHGWHVYQPVSMMEALAMYITYMPDVTVIHDAGCPGWQAEAFFHLMTLEDDTPFLLTGTPQPGGVVVAGGHEALIAAIRAAMGHEALEF